jgi:hypothetical protein
LACIGNVQRARFLDQEEALGVHRQWGPSRNKDEEIERLVLLTTRKNEKVISNYIAKYKNAKQ